MPSRSSKEARKGPSQYRPKKRKPVVVKTPKRTPTGTGTKHVSYVRPGGSGPKRALTYKGTPVSTTGIPMSRAASAAERVKAAAERVKRSSTTRDIPGLDSEQEQVLRTLVRQGNRVGADRQEKLAAVATGLVESNLTEVDQMLDHDSLNWRQERASIYGPKWAKTGGPLNTKASAGRFYREARSLDRGQSPGELAADVQRPAEEYRGRYAENMSEAQRLLKLARGKKPRRSDVKVLRKAGVKVRPTKGASAPQGPKRGPYAGSRKMVRQLLGAPVRGDKEPGHSAGGMHDPANPRAYAQDIGSSGGNPAEGEPEYSQATVSRVVRNLRSRGADIPSGFKLGQNWTGTVDGYEIEFLTAPHGTGPHIHLGAEYEGGGDSSGGVSGGAVSGGGAYSASVGGSGEVVASGPGSARERAQSHKRRARQRLGRVRRAYGEGGESKTSNPELSRLVKKYGVAV